ncbi:ribonuclease H-like domain-containing protein [Tanacetum coccineum]
MLESCKKSKKIEALKGCLFVETKGEEGEDMLSSSVLAGKSPFSMLYGREPPLSHLSPYDDGEGPSDDAGEVIVDHQSIDTAEEQPFDEHHTASSTDDNPISEGNVPNFQNVPTFDSSNKTDLDSPEEAVKDINWVQAMNNKMEALYLNNTWILTDFPKNRKAIGSKWVFKIKYKSDGEIERYNKARLVAKGFGQKEGIDYDEIFSPVMKMSTYCIELLHEYGLLACKLVATPMPENGILPEIAYSVHCLSQHMHSPLQSHFEAALKVLRYLKSAPGAGIVYSKSSISSISASSDSDWAKCKMTRRSVSGYCVFVFGGLVSWKSKKQATLSRSSTEAEYRSMASAVYKVMWMVKILKDLNFTNVIPASLFCDNSSAIQIAANLVIHDKTKHFDIAVHLVREKVAHGLIKTVKVDSEKQVADILTKGLGSMQRNELCSKLTLKNLFGS